MKSLKSNSWVNGDHPNNFYHVSVSSRDRSHLSTQPITGTLGNVACCNDQHSLQSMGLSSDVSNDLLAFSRAWADTHNDDPSWAHKLHMSYSGELALAYNSCTSCTTFSIVHVLVQNQMVESQASYRWRWCTRPRALLAITEIQSVSLWRDLLWRRSNGSHNPELQWSQRGSMKRVSTHLDIDGCIVGPHVLQSHRRDSVDMPFPQMYRTGEWLQLPWSLFMMRKQWKVISKKKSP